MRVYRNGRLKEYPAQALIVATTNLCPCGKWTPVNPQSRSCSLSSYRCKSYGRRLSGPLVDRFEILEFTEGIGQLEINGSALFERIQRAQKFSQENLKSDLPNSRKSIEDLSQGLPVTFLKHANFDEQTSHRRRLAVLRVARTLADLDLSEQIKVRHLDEAVLRCQVYFQKLINWG